MNTRTPLPFFYQLAILSVTFISSCKENSKLQETDMHTKEESKFELASSEYVVLKYQPEWHWVFKNGNPVVLTNSELIEIETILSTAITKNNEKQKQEVLKQKESNPNTSISNTGYEIKSSDYKRQYIPIQNSTGQKEVFVIFFCADLDLKNWRTELVQVEDGGNCFFNFKINLSTKVHELAINYSL
jgi:hypothetical protein